MHSTLRSTARLLLRLEIWAAGLALLAGAVSSSALPYALAGLLAFWPLRWLAAGWLTRRTPLDLPVGLLVIMSLVTLAITAHPEITRPQVFALWLGILAYYALANGLETASAVRWASAGMLLAPLALAVIGVLGVGMDTETLSKLPFIPPSVYNNLPSVLSDSINTNVLAGNLAFLLPFAACRMVFPLHRRDAWIRVAAGFATLAVIAVGVLSQSRNAIIGIGLVAVLVFLLRWPRQWYLLFFLPLAAGIAVWFFRESDQLFMYWIILRGGALSTLDHRVDIWMRALFMIQDFPITGIGMGSFPIIADALYPFALEPRNIPHAHNLFLQIAVDLGTPGLIAWLAAWLAMIAMAWQSYRRGLAYRGLGAAVFISQIILAGVGLVDAVTWGGIKTANLVWLVWGFGAAVWLNGLKVDAKASIHTTGDQPVDEDGSGVTVLQPGVNQ